MSRSFHADDLVQLPIVTASGAIALGMQLVTVASAEPELPQGVGRALDKVKETQEDLHTAVKRQLITPADERQREVDVVLDRAWAGVQLLCLSHAKLSSTSLEATRANRVLVTLFPDGLRFTQLPYKAEWVESDTRIALIRDEHLDEDIHSLGGEAHLQALYTAHKEYGEVLGITQLAPIVPQSPSVRDPLTLSLRAIRKYVVCIVASVDEDDPATGALAERLLRPLVDWPTRAVSPSQPPPAPVPPTAATIPA